MGFFKRFSAKRFLMALVGVFLICIGVSFNNCAGLGNDTVGIVYDGMRAFWGMTGEQLGTASNLVNVVLVILLFLIGRKYVSLGTLIYFLPYGFFVGLGTSFYGALNLPAVLPAQIIASIIGCLLLCAGVGIYIAADIGVDPFTGLVLVLCDRLKKEYRIVKIVFDVVCIIVGTLLGGKLGVVTVATAIVAGPVIQFFTETAKKYFLNN